MGIEIAAITHVGKSRKNNEDAYIISSLDGEEPRVNARLEGDPDLDNGLLIAVADGMGGAAAGEIASREALACLAIYLFGHWARLPEVRDSEEALVNAFTGAVREASDAIIRYSYEDRSSRGMGTTLTAVVLWKGRAYLSQIGDSRAYIYREGRLRQVSDDQTLVNNLVMAGSITPEQARSHPQRNMITQALGAPRPVDVKVVRIPLCYGDRVLLCSDGLHGELDDAEIAAALGRDGGPRGIVETLIGNVLNKGAKDNVTILIATLNDPSLPQSRRDSIEIEDPLRRPNDNYDGILSRVRRLLAGRS